MYDHYEEDFFVSDPTDVLTEIHWCQWAYGDLEYSYFSLVYASGEALTYDTLYDQEDPEECGSVTGLGDKTFTSVCFDENDDDGEC